MVRTLPALLVLVACDGGASPDPPAETLQVGTGEDAWRAFSDDGAHLVRGSQGLQHVVVSLRWPLDPDDWVTDRARVQVSGTLEDGASVGADVDAGLGVIADGEVSVVLGVLWVVEDPEAVLGARVRLTAEVAPVGLDARWSGATEVSVRWAPGEVDAAE